MGKRSNIDNIVGVLFIVLLFVTGYVLGAHDWVTALWFFIVGFVTLSLIVAVTETWADAKLTWIAVGVAVAGLLFGMFHLLT